MSSSGSNNSGSSSNNNNSAGNAWIPANARIDSYNKLNYNFPIKIVGGHMPEAIKNVTRRTIGNRLGNNSTFGSVHKLGTDDRYVIKTMVFKKGSNTDYLKIFLNEVKVGRIPAIKKVGPRIYAWRIIRNPQGTAIKGQYIMDSFTRGKPLKVQTVGQYLKGTCPAPASGSPFFIKLKEALFNFWNITKGYHGDLHKENMVVLLKNNGEISHIQIFDYGAHKRFKESTKSTCFEEYVDQIDREFKKRYNKVGNDEFYPPQSKVKIVHPTRGQSFRPNTNMLRAFKASKNKRPIRHGFYQSIMHGLVGQENITKRIPAGKTAMNLNKAGYTHRNFFVNPSVWMNKVGYARLGNKLFELYKRSNPTKSNANIRDAMIKHYKKSPDFIYNTNRSEMSNMFPANKEKMFKNLGLSIFKPKNPRNYVVKAYRQLINRLKKKKLSHQNIKQKVLEQLKENSNEGRFVNMPNKYKMYENFRNHY